jgi:hypothetical protein
VPTNRRRRWPCRSTPHRRLYRLEEINLTDGDHVVHASAHSAVIGGTGDNTIHDAGFAYGGIGDSTIYNATHAYGGIGNARLIGGNLLVAGTGDQWLENGATMVVGDGHNTVVGGAGQVVQVGRDNIGRDLVLGQGDQTWNVLDAVYRAQGIYDWQEGYEHGGQYYLSNNEFGQGKGITIRSTDLKSALAALGVAMQDLLGTGEVRGGSASCRFSLRCRAAGYRHSAALCAHQCAGRHAQRGGPGGFAALL